MWIIPRKKDNLPVFQSYFQSVKYGIALGIGGDKSYNLLWRIQNREYLRELQPKVYWVLIGTS